MTRNAGAESAFDRIRSRVRRTRDLGEVRARPTALGGMRLAMDYFAVAATPRFRAGQRSRVRDAAQSGMILVIVTATLNCLWLIPSHPAAARLLIALNLTPALIGALAYRAVTRRARRHPEDMSFAVLAALDVALVVVGVVEHDLDIVASGYLLLMPMIVATVMPWGTKYHAAWIAFHTCVALGYAVLAPTSMFGGVGRPDVFALFIVASTISVFGHVNRLRARVQNFIQMEEIRAFHRQGRRDQERLDRLNRMLEHTARTDDLTDLKNRLSLKLDLAVVRSRIARHGQPYGLLMVDLDRFKAINDSLGHVSGDDVLRRTAAAIAGAVRQVDAVYRYGGEEFLVLLDSTDLPGAVVAAERMRQVVSDLEIAHPGNPPHGRVTASVGVATIDSQDVDADDDAWIARADAALYRAKANGRNRCETEATTGRRPGLATVALSR
jgi:diguanylate cyclase (GGDEF)-like protein